MRRLAVDILLLVVALGAGVLVYRSVAERFRERDARTERIELRNDSLSVELSHVTAWGVAQEVRADSAETVADSLAALKQKVITRYIEVPVPAECEPFTAPRDTALQYAQQQIDALETVVDAERAAKEAESRKVAIVTEQRDSLQVIVDEYGSPSSRFAVGVGPYYGVDTQMQPSTGIAVSGIITIDPIRDLVRVIRWAF